MAYEMAYSNEGPFTFTSGEALAADRLIKPSAGTAVYADAGEEPIGITQEPVASGVVVACAPMDSRIRKVTASKAIASGADLYVANDGKVSDAAVGKQIGIALSAASADGGKIPAIIWGPRGGNDLFSSMNSICEFKDEFFQYDDTATVGNWVEVHDGTPATGIIDAVYGIASFATGGTDNNETYISSNAECWKFQTDKKLFFEARVKLTEANTDDANIIVGLSDTVAADSLLDNGGGPMASYGGAVFFKVDGGTVWQAETSNGATQNTDTNAGAFTTATWHTLQIFYDYNDGTTAKVYFYVDGVLGATENLTISGLGEMHILLGAKAGGGNAETLLVDYVRVVTER